MERTAFRRGVVAVGITVLLFIGVLGVLHQLRQNAQQKQCISNLRMLSNAIALYEDDYGSTMPWGSGAHPLPKRKTGESNWSDLAAPYSMPLYRAIESAMEGHIKDYLAILACPSAPQLERNLYLTYGYNRYLARVRRWSPLDIRPEQVKYRATTLRITETYWAYRVATKMGVEGRFQEIFAPVPDWEAASLDGPVVAPGWHRGKNNVLWVDGHVSTMTKEEVMRTDSNKDPNVWARLSPKPTGTPGQDE